MPKGNWTESNTIIVLDRTEIKGKTFFYCTNSFIIIKVQLPIDNAQMKRNAIQVISFIPIMKNAIYKRDIVSKCKTTIIFDWIIIAAHPQSIFLHFLVQFYARNPSCNTSLNPTCIQILPPSLSSVIKTVFKILKELM